MKSSSNTNDSYSEAHKQEKLQRKIYEQVDAELTKIHEALHALGVTVIEHEGDQSNFMIARRMNDFAACNERLESLSEQIQGHVPFELLGYIDKGQSPAEFTRDFLERAAAENQFVKGKLNNLADFADILKAESESLFEDFEAH